MTLVYLFLFAVPFVYSSQLKKADRAVCRSYCEISARSRSSLLRRSASGVLWTPGCHGGPQQPSDPCAAALRLPSAGRGGLPAVLAAGGPEQLPGSVGPGEPHQGQVRAEPAQHRQPVRGRVLPAAHRERLRAAGQRLRQVRLVPGPRSQISGDLSGSRRCMFWQARTNMAGFQQADLSRSIVSTFCSINP